MGVKAKFRCQSVTDFGKTKQVHLNAIYGYTGENADFTKVTPWGEVKMNIDSDAPASNYFKPQSDYYLTFEECMPIEEVTRLEDPSPTR